MKLTKSLIANSSLIILFKFQVVLYSQSLKTGTGNTKIPTAAEQSLPSPVCHAD